MEQSIIQIACAGLLYNLEKLMSLPAINMNEDGLPVFHLSAQVEHMIAEADRLAAGGIGAAGIPPNGRTTAFALRSIFKQMVFQDRPGALDEDRADRVYPLRKITSESIFPNNESRQPNHTESDHGMIKNLLDELTGWIKTYPMGEAPSPIWFEFLDSLLMQYTANIPAYPADPKNDDISLYDHSRVTAALTTALYLYHAHHQTLTPEEIGEDTPIKFLFVSGDFYGIQDFIFSSHGGAQRYRAKLLRGRSFSVSLFSELAADLICRTIGLPHTAIILNAGGKFTILAPNTPAAREAVESVEQTVNKWLVNMSYGQNSLGLTMLPASGRDLKRSSFHRFWRTLQQKVAQKKYDRIDLDRYGGAFEHYLDRFAGRPLCPLCGKRPSQEKAAGSSYLKTAEGETTEACSICRDQVFLGTKLVKQPIVAILDRDAWPSHLERGLFEPIFGRYQLEFISANKSRAQEDYVFHYWNLADHIQPAQDTMAAVKFINGHVPRIEDRDRYDPRFDDEMWKGVKVGDPKTFSHLAALALNIDQEKVRGFAALGVLKADVDDLGRLMAFGLPRDAFTISRQATLSRQLNFFFTLYLPSLLRNEERLNNIYTVFAGGDDLFAIGPWNRVIELVGELDRKFAEYVCHNPQIHFSAGITLHKSFTPVSQLAEAAEAALETSKVEDKRRLTLFGETVRLTEFNALRDIKKEMKSWLDDKRISRVMLYRINELIQMAGEERRMVTPDGLIDIKDLSCLRWRPLLAYSVERNAGGDLKGIERETFIRDMQVELATWIEKYHSRLIIPLWEILYEVRRVGK